MLTMRVAGVRHRANQDPRDQYLRLSNKSGLVRCGQMMRCQLASVVCYRSLLHIAPCFMDQCRPRRKVRRSSRVLRRYVSMASSVVQRRPRKARAPRRGVRMRTFHRRGCYAFGVTLEKVSSGV